VAEHFRCAQCKAVRHRGEFVSGADAISPKRWRDAADGWDEGCSASEEDAVYFARMDAALLKSESMQASMERRSSRSSFEFGAQEWGLRRSMLACYGCVAEAEFAASRCGQLEFDQLAD